MATAVLASHSRQRLSQWDCLAIADTHWLILTRKLSRKRELQQMGHGFLSVLAKMLLHRREIYNRNAFGCAIRRSEWGLSIERTAAPPQLLYPGCSPFSVLGSPRLFGGKKRMKLLS